MNLVADLDHLREHSLIGEAFENVPGVIVHLVSQLVVAEALPRGGRELFARVRPIVAVVEIEQKLHARGLDALGHFHGLIQAAVSLIGVAVSGSRIHKQPEPDPIELVF